MSITKPGVGGKRPTRNTVMCSLRIERQLKEGLQTIARRQVRSLSSLITQVLRDFMQSRKADLSPRPIQEEKRHFPRKEVVLPGRWRRQMGDKRQEHDVLVKNISAGGAYTEHVNGHHYRLFENSPLSSLELVVRLPGSMEPVVLACEPRHCHVTKECLSLGLQFTAKMEEQNKVALEHFLT